MIPQYIAQMYLVSSIESWMVCVEQLFCSRAVRAIAASIQPARHHAAFSQSDETLHNCNYLGAAEDACSWSYRMWARWQIPMQLSSSQYEAKPRWSRVRHISIAGRQNSGAVAGLPTLTLFQIPLCCSRLQRCLVPAQQFVWAHCCWAGCHSQLRFPEAASVPPSSFLKAV